MVEWHQQLNGHEFGWTPEVGDGQGGLECCGSWGHKESDTTEQLNQTEHTTPSGLVSSSVQDAQITVSLCSSCWQ